MKKRYHYFVWRCEESTEARGRTNQPRATPCGSWAIHRTRAEGTFEDTLKAKPRARCVHDHGGGKTRRQYLTEENVAPENRFEWKSDAEVRKGILNDREEREEASA